MPTDLMLTTEELADRSGLTPSQVHRYCAVGAFGERNRKPGSGGRRSYDETDLLIARTMAKVAVLAGALTSQTPSLGMAMAGRISAAIRRRDSHGRYLSVSEHGCHVWPGPVVSDGATLVVEL